MKYINNEYFYFVDAFIFNDKKSVKDMLESEDFNRFLENIGCKVKIQRNNGETEYVFNRVGETNEFFSEKIEENLIIHIAEVLVYSFHTERLTKYPIKNFHEKFTKIKN